jgi:hypothetical protein
MTTIPNKAKTAELPISRPQVVVVVVIVVVAGVLLLPPLDAATAMATAATAIPAMMMGVLPLNCAVWTPAGFPGVRGSLQALGAKIMLATTVATQRFRIFSS